MLVRLRVTSQTASGFQAKALGAPVGLVYMQWRWSYSEKTIKYCSSPPTHTHICLAPFCIDQPQDWIDSLDLAKQLPTWNQRKQHTEGHSVRQEPRQQPLQMQPCRAPLLVREVLAWTVGGYMTLLCTLTKLVKSFRSTITLLRKC